MDTSFTHTLFLYLLLQHLLHVLLIVTFSNCQIFCDLFVLAVIEYFFLCVSANNLCRDFVSHLWFYC